MRFHDHGRDRHDQPVFERAEAARRSQGHLEPDGPSSRITADPGGGGEQATPAEVDSRVAVRMRRQEVLTRERPIRLWAIVGEGALRHRVGDIEVMRRQMLRLTEAAKEPNVTLQVLPFEAGAHPGMLGSFHVLNFGDVELPDVVYIDSMAGDLFLDRADGIDRYTVIFEYLRAIALSPESSVSLITKLAEGG